MYNQRVLDLSSKLRLSIVEHLAPRLYDASPQISDDSLNSLTKH